MVILVSFQAQYFVDRLRKLSPSSFNSENEMCLAIDNQIKCVNDKYNYHYLSNKNNDNIPPFDLIALIAIRLDVKENKFRLYVIDFNSPPYLSPITNSYYAIGAGANYASLLLGTNLLFSCALVT